MRLGMGPRSAGHRADELRQSSRGVPSASVNRTLPIPSCTRLLSSSTATRAALQHRGLCTHRAAPVIAKHPQHQAQASNCQRIRQGASRPPL